MFFASIIALPVLAGLLVGTFTTSRRPADLLAGVCVLIGLAGAVSMLLDDDTTSRVSAAAFGVVAGAVGAGLVYLGRRAGRAAMSRLRRA